MFLSSACNAMDTKPTILMSIQSIKKPHCGYFLNEKEIIISGKNGCTIFNTETKQEEKVGNLTSPFLTVHPNKELFALSDSNTVTIYDTKKRTQEWTHNNNNNNNDFPWNIIASIFSPLDDTIFLLYGSCIAVQHYNYKNNQSHTKVYGYGQTTPMISFHPTEKYMCHVTNQGHSTFFYNMNFVATSDEKYSNVCQGEHIFSQFSPNGSLLVSGNKEGFSIGNGSGPTTDNMFFEQEKNKTLQEVVFHPNGDFIITLSQPDNVINYWDINLGKSYSNVALGISLQPTVTIVCSPSADNPSTEHRHMCRYLSCDPNGERLLVVLANECVVLPVPLEVMCHDGTKNRCTFASLVLCNYLYNKHDRLPQDVICLLLSKLIAISKR